MLLKRDRAFKPPSKWEWGSSHLLILCAFLPSTISIALPSQPASLITMAGKKGKSDNTQASGGKGKGKGKQDSTQADKAAPAKNKNAQTIDVCHILCEKFSQREAAYEELTNGTLSWKGACEKYSVDKARSG